MIRTGVYEHYKGGRYEVLGCALHSETKDVLVVYRALYGNKQLWVRPLVMFKESVETKSGAVPRFRLISTDKPLQI